MMRWNPYPPPYKRESLCWFPNNYNEKKNEKKIKVLHINSILHLNSHTNYAEDYWC